MTSVHACNALQRSNAVRKYCNGDSSIHPTIIISYSLLLLSLNLLILCENYIRIKFTYNIDMLC